VPESWDRENPNGCDPRESDSGRPPRQSGKKQKRGDRDFYQPPPEAPVCSSDREMNPAVRVIKQHDADGRTEQRKDATRLSPARAEQQQDHVLADERQKRTDAHSNECER